jgi:RimJ/RimL family protein N-acetyltransferase
VENLALAGGREVQIRPIRPDDAEPLQTAYARLSPQSKYRRFLAPKPYLTSSDTRYLVHVDGHDHLALVATPARDPSTILGVARFVRLPEDPELAELAVVVGDPFQREGLATALLARLADAARERGVRRFRGTMLAQNLPADRLVRGAAAGGIRVRSLGPVKELEIDLA